MRCDVNWMCDQQQQQQHQQHVTVVIRVCRCKCAITTTKFSYVVCVEVVVYLRQSLRTEIVWHTQHIAAFRRHGNPHHLARELNRKRNEICGRKDSRSGWCVCQHISSFVFRFFVTFIVNILNKDTYMSCMYTHKHTHIKKKVSLYQEFFECIFESFLCCVNYNDCCEVLNIGRRFVDI